MPPIVFLILLFLLPSPPLQAQEKEASAERPRADLALIRRGGNAEQLLSVWLRRERAIKERDPERADELFVRLVQLQKEAGVRRLDAAARALLKEAKEQPALAGIRLGQAEKIAPGLPEIYDESASFILKQKTWALHKWITYQTKAFSARLADFRLRAMMLSSALLLFFICLGVFILVFYLAQFIRYGLSIYYDLSQTFPSVMRFVLLAAVASILMFPFFYGLGPLLLFFPATVLLWSYQTQREQVIALIFLLLLGCSPWILRMGARLGEAGTGNVQALHTLNYNVTDKRAKEAVEEAIKREPGDWLSRAILGLAHKRQGQLSSAAELLQAALKIASEEEIQGVIQNNLGNVYLAEGRRESALKAYKRSSQLLPNAPEPIFNRYRLHTRLGEEDEAERALHEASALDAQQIALWSESDDIQINCYLVDMDLPTGVMTQRAFSKIFSGSPHAERIWVLLAGPIPEMTVPIAALLCLFSLGALFSLRRRMRFSWPCQRCGQPASESLRDGRPENLLCVQCESIFVQNKPVERRIRFLKEEEIERFQSLKRWGTRLSGLFPGLLHTLWARPWRGALWTALSTWLLLRIFYPAGLLLEPSLQYESPTWFLWTLYSALALLWLFHLYKAFRWTLENN